MFFLSDNNQLVLVDITEEKDLKIINNKKKDLNDWINREQSNIPQYQLAGIVLAPNIQQNMLHTNISGDDEGLQSKVLLVSGEDALQLLFGLRQMAPWFE